MSLPRTVGEVILAGWSSALYIHPAQMPTWYLNPWSPRRPHWHIQGPGLIQERKKYIEAVPLTEVTWGGFGFVPGCHLSVAGYSREAASH